MLAFLRRRRPSRRDARDPRTIRPPGPLAAMLTDDVNNIDALTRALGRREAREAS